MMFTNHKIYTNFFKKDKIEKWAISQKRTFGLNLEQGVWQCLGERNLHCGSAPMHSSTFVFDPEQLAPLQLRSSKTHSRLCVCFPLPHDDEQCPHSPHSDHFPSVLPGEAFLNLSIEKKKCIKTKKVTEEYA